VVSADASPSTWEGARVVSSYADLADALAQEHVDPAQVAFAAAGAGLDSLGLVTNPLGSLLGAGIGWLIEHVDFLSEPLDALAGDPGAVLQQARAWQGVSAELSAAAIGYREAAATVATGWDGAAADAYALDVRRCTVAMDTAARDAEQLANVVVSTGAAVGTLRALIRDSIARFLAKVIQWVVAALAAATVTAGFSLAALIAAVVEQASSLARMFVQRMSGLLDHLEEAGVAARGLGQAMRDAAAQFAPGPMVDGARILHGAARRVSADWVVEAGKQHTGAEQEQRGWTAGG
jgi:uncharacterized protein YukE